MFEAGEITSCGVSEGILIIRGKSWIPASGNIPVIQTILVIRQYGGLMPYSALPPEVTGRQQGLSS
jgi:hypothetical protein